MFRKIINYSTYGRDSLYNLDKTIQKAIAQGWQPIGGVTQDDDDDYIQAMVRYEEEPKKNLAVESSPTSVDTGDLDFAAACFKAREGYIVGHRDLSGDFTMKCGKFWRTSMFQDYPFPDNSDMDKKCKLSKRWYVKKVKTETTEPTEPKSSGFTFKEAMDIASRGGVVQLKDWLKHLLGIKIFFNKDKNSLWLSDYDRKFPQPGIDDDFISKPSEWEVLLLPTQEGVTFDYALKIAKEEGRMIFRKIWKHRIMGNSEYYWDKDKEKLLRIGDLPTLHEFKYNNDIRETDWVIGDIFEPAQSRSPKSRTLKDFTAWVNGQHLFCGCESGRENFDWNEFEKYIEALE